MALSKDKIIKYTQRLLVSRMRLLSRHGFYGLLLMHTIYALDDKVETAATDGKRIVFSPSFLDDISDGELDYVVLHEILHTVLQHCLREKNYDAEKFGMACDIVVNSNILLEYNMNPDSISLRRYGGIMPHVAPDGKEGYEYTAEQVYQMLQTMDSDETEPDDSDSQDGNKSDSTDSDCNNPDNGDSSGEASWDNHSAWGNQEDSSLKDNWTKHLKDAIEAIQIREASTEVGTLPLFAQRFIDELRSPQTDWRTVLNDFVQEEITDYSFFPPDRRFDDSIFFLPDFNAKEDIADKILFMVDTSASMSDEMISAAYAEVKGAVDQFDGRLTGWLGFFDAEVIEPVPFSDINELKAIKPFGGGGTNFHVIFSYIRENMMDSPPACVIVLTDGYAAFPEEECCCGIPVLWLLNNNNVVPAWGKVARIEI